MAVRSRSLNPDILPPSRLPLTPKERRRVAIAAILILIAAALVGCAYWTGKDRPRYAPDRNSTSQLSLTPEQSAEKSAIISNTSSAQVKLSPEEKRRKEELLNGLRQ